MRSLSHYLRHIQMGLVLGYGHIGREVAEFLERACGFTRDNILVCDPRLQSGDIKTPFKPWERKHGGCFDLVVGCSGTTSFDVGDSVFLNDGAVMVSVSSGAVEFNRRNVVEWAAASQSDDLWIGDSVDTTDLHSAIPIRYPHRNVTLLNGGFPANFDGRISCVPGRYIQITMALMVQAAVPAVRAAQADGLPGVHAVDADVCLDLTEAFYEEAADAAHWLPDKEDVLDEIRKNQ